MSNGKIAFEREREPALRVRIEGRAWTESGGGQGVERIVGEETNVARIAVM